MAYDSMLKCMLFGGIIGKRLAGRAKAKWDDQLMHDLVQLGTSIIQR